MAAPSRVVANLFRNVRQYLRSMRLPTFRGIAASSTANAVWPLGITVHAIFLRFTIAGAAATEAQIKAQISRIRLKIDGDAKIDATSTELIALNEFWQRRAGQATVVDGVLRIDLSRPWDQEISAQDGPAWGLATQNPDGSRGVDSFTAELDIAAAATIDGVEAHALVSDAEPLGRHLCIRRYGLYLGAAGDLEFNDFNKSADYGVLAMHFAKVSQPEAAYVVTHVALKVDQIDELDKTPAGLLESQYRRYGCVKQAGWTHIPFCGRGRPLDVLPLIGQDMRLKITANAALNNFDLICEQYEGVDPAPVQR